MYQIRVITACRNSLGWPEMVPTIVYIDDSSDFDDGAHYEMAESELYDNGYESPYVHFDETECPDYIFQHFFPNVLQYKSLEQLLEAQE